MKFVERGEAVSLGPVGVMILIVSTRASNRVWGLVTSFPLRRPKLEQAFAPTTSNVLPSESPTSLKVGR